MTLLRFGAEIEAETIDGQTPLRMALLNGAGNAAPMLLQNGASLINALELPSQRQQQQQQQRRGGEIKEEETVQDKGGSYENWRAGNQNYISIVQYDL